VLLMFEKIQILIARAHQERVYKIIFQDPATFIPAFHREIEKLNLHCRRERDMKENESYILLYAIYGSEKKLDQLNAFLKNAPEVNSYEY
jgi:hypothetical protein